MFDLFEQLFAWTIKPKEEQRRQYIIFIKSSWLMRQIGYNLEQDIMGVFTVGLQPMVLIRNTNEKCLAEIKKKEGR